MSAGVTFRPTRKDKLLTLFLLVLHCSVISLAILVLVTPNQMFGESAGMANLQINGTAYDLFIASIGASTNLTANDAQSSSMTSSTSELARATATAMPTSTTPITAPDSAVSTTPGPSATDSATVNPAAGALKGEIHSDHLNGSTASANKLRRRTLVHYGAQHTRKPFRTSLQNSNLLVTT